MTPRLPITCMSLQQAEDWSRQRVTRLLNYNSGEQTMPLEFQSLDEASHHLYLGGHPGPIRCRVDGSTWDVWQDGRSALVSESDAV